MKNTLKKFAASLISVCMLFSSIPVTAFSDTAPEPSDNSGMPVEAILPTSDIPFDDDTIIDNVILPEAAAAVQAMVDALPSVDALTDMSAEERAAACEATQAAYSAYLALTEAEQATVTGMDKVQALLEAFDSMTAPDEERYTINCLPVQGATITATNDTAAAGESVSVTITLDSGYVLKRLTLNGEDVASQVGENGIYTFVMPAEDAEISAETARVYAIYIGNREGFIISADKAQAEAGETVTLTVVANTDDIGVYYLHEIYVYEVEGDSVTLDGKIENADGSITCTFTMPAKEVDIFAATSYDWYVSDNALYVKCKLTELPDGDYSKIAILPDGELALNNDVIVDHDIVLAGTISGGTYTGSSFSASNMHCINGGIFEVEITASHDASINGGTFKKEVYFPNGAITGGVFEGNVRAGNISDGTFNGTVYNVGMIFDGAFNGTVYNAGRITGGTFNGDILYNSFDTSTYDSFNTITGGVFRCKIYNPEGSIINGGEFHNEIINNASTESFHNVKLCEGASVTGNQPQYVIHSKNGVDITWRLGATLLGNILNTPEAGYAWYCNSSPVAAGDTVPLIYSTYTSKKLLPINIEGSYITASAYSAAAGEEVTITANSGYAIKRLTLNGEDVTSQVGEDGTYTFVMPEEGAEISAETKRLYHINIENPMGYIITADKIQAASGETVTLNVIANKDDIGSFEFKELLIFDASGNSITFDKHIENADGSHTFTFTMPANTVDIYANIGCNWYISNDTLYLGCKLTELPEGDYSKIIISSLGELALSNDVIVDHEITLVGTISGGTYTNSAFYANNGFIISGGIFKIAINSSQRNSYINGGTFEKEVFITNGTITGGIFESDADARNISGGTFNGKTSSTYGTISGGTFNGNVNNGSTISGGTFNGDTLNNYSSDYYNLYFGTITGGVFHCKVYNFNEGIISGGEFHNEITNFDYTDSLYNVKLCEGASVSNEQPLSVIHCVNGTDTALPYWDKASGSPALLDDSVELPGADYICLVNGVPAKAGNELPLIYSDITFGRPFSISVDEDITNGTVTAPDFQCAGYEVNITAEPAEGFRLNAITVTSGDVNVDVAKLSDGGFSFTMPEGEVYITAEFSKVYTVSISGAEGGTVTADKTQATAGETVTLQVSPKNDASACYSFVGITIKVAEDNNNPLDNVTAGADNTFTFTMPASNVTAEAEFEKVWEVVGGELRIYGEVTELPEDAEYSSIGIYENGILNLSDDEEVSVDVHNNNLISGGRFTEDSTVFNMSNGSVEGGIFEGRVVNNGTIENGVFTEDSAVANMQNGTIEDGKFDCSVSNVGGDINGGEFSGRLNNSEGTIGDIKFTGETSDLSGIQPESVIHCVNGTDMSVRRMSGSGSMIPLYDALPALDTGYGWYRDGALAAEDATVPVKYSSFTSGPIEYTVTVDPSIENCTVTADSAACFYLDEVSLDISVDEGYRLTSVYYILNGGQYSIPASGTFTMPAGNITIVAETEKIHTVDIEYPEVNSIVYGEAVTEAMFSGGSTEYGTFEWHPDMNGATPNVGAHTSTVVFIPADTETYYWAEEVLSRDVTFNVLPRNATITIESLSKVYGEEDPEFVATVYNLANSDTLLVTVSREAGEDVGEYNLIPAYEADANYNYDLLIGVLTITPADIGNAKVSGISDAYYTGKAIEPVPTVKFNGEKLLKGADYTVSYANNTETGTASVIITGKGNFAGSVTVRFDILPVPSEENTADTEQPMTGTAEETVRNLLGFGPDDSLSGIVFDSEGAFSDYTLELIENETEDNSRLMITAVSDDDTALCSRSMVLSESQLNSLSNEHKVSFVAFENDGAVAMFSVADVIAIDPVLLSENTGLEIPAEGIRDYSIEIRITPVETDEIAAFEVSVWLIWNGTETDISGMIPSLTAGFCAKTLISAEDEAARFTVSHKAPEAEEATALECELIGIPGELHTAHASYSAAFAEDMSIAVYEVTDAQQHYVLAAAYAGEGIYTVSEAK